MFSDRSINRSALLVTVLFHIAILAIPLRDKALSIMQKPAAPLPINFEMKEVVIKKPAPKPVVKKKTKRKKQRKAVAKKVKKAKKPMPGDRKTAEVISTAVPLYPKEAINYAWEGTIVVLATIDSAGKVIKTTVLESTGHQKLDDSFLETLNQGYVFNPKRMYGENTQDTIKLSYRFEL